MPTLAKQIEQAVEMIQQANHMVAMTGAGFSTPSGIPDFRSPESGIWQETDATSVASIYAFRHDPQKFYDWVRPLASILLQAEPNAAHYTLVDLEARGKLHAVITQNIDGLHEKAGSQTVHKLHGHLQEFTCVECYQNYEVSEEIVDEVLTEGAVPRCRCGQGGVLKPNVILFGEQLPAREYVAAQMAVKQADLLLVAGSSLEVSPAADLPRLGLEHGARLLIINQQPTHVDDQAELVIQADVAEILPEIARQLN